MKYFRFDTETFPIRPGLLAPRMVCLQHAYDVDRPSILLRRDALDTLKSALEDPEVLPEAHNGAYDQAVTAAAHPELLPLWFWALGQKRGRDTQIREALIDIKEGTFQQQKPKGHYSLAGIAKRRLGLEMDKSEESWRLRYALLDDVPVAEWPLEAVQYAKDDVTVLREVSQAQLRVYEPEDEWLQVAAAFCLQLCAVWGVRSDEASLQGIKADLIQKRDTAEAILDRAGFFRKGSVDLKAVQCAVEKAAQAAKRVVPRTDKGNIKADADTCEKLKDYVPELTALSELTQANKFLTTYIEPMEFGSKYAMNSRPNVLVASGRTSWAGSSLREANPWWPEGVKGQEVKVGTNLQNFPRVSGIRDNIIPRQGNWMWSVDWSSLELRALAQVLLWTTGRSKMAERYQADADYDPHSEMAASLMGITYEEALRLKKAKDEKFLDMRQLSKALMFGFPGGLGARTFVTFADQQYGVTITEAEAKDLKIKFLDTWPEMKDYFDYVSWLSESGRPYRQWVSGRLRGGIGFCDGCNTGFQGLGGDAAKYALVRVSQACYVEPDSPLFGSRVLVLVHDELIGESAVDRAPEACMEVVRLMNESLAVFTPDIPPASEPALMSRWLKKAAVKHGADGRLTAWG